MTIGTGKGGFPQSGGAIAGDGGERWQATVVTCFADVTVVFFLIFILPPPQAMADSEGCARLEGKIVRAATDASGGVLQGAFRLSDREPVALFDQKGGRIFGSLSVVPFRQGYEAFWKPMSGSPQFLIMLNGKQKAALMYPRNMHWLVPYPLGTVVGPLVITSCAGVFANPNVRSGH